MTLQMKVSLIIATLNALVVALMSMAFNIPVVPVSVAVWIVTLFACLLMFGLCNAASTTDAAIDAASKVHHDGD